MSLINITEITLENDELPEFTQALDILEDQTGFVRHSIYQDNNRNHITVFEEWETKSDFEAFTTMYSEEYITKWNSDSSSQPKKSFCTKVPNDFDKLNEARSNYEGTDTTLVKEFTANFINEMFECNLAFTSYANGIEDIDITFIKTDAEKEDGNWSEVMIFPKAIQVGFVTYLKILANISLFPKIEESFLEKFEFEKDGKVQEFLLSICSNSRGERITISTLS
jgi:heme-degrading monooxygenase HmoA